MRSTSTTLTIIDERCERYGNEKPGPSWSYRDRGLFARTRAVGDGSGETSGCWKSSAVGTRQRESIGFNRNGVSFVQGVWLDTGSLDENAARLRHGVIAITQAKDQRQSHSWLVEILRPDEFLRRQTPAVGGPDDGLDVEVLDRPVIWRE